MSHVTTEEKSRPAWRRFSGELAHPTLVLSAVVVLLWTGSLVAVLVGVLPIALGFAVSTLAAYVAFTPMHEAAHGNVGGRHKHLARLDTATGWLMGLFLFAPFPAFKALHLRHHGCTNDADRDPDFWVKGSNPFWVAMRCWTIMPHYYAHFLFTLKQSSGQAKRERIQVITTLIAFIVLVVVAALMGHFSTALWLWVAPALVATGFLALAFDYIPHHPHSVQGRYVDTNTIPSRGLEVIMLGQNYHGVHHLYPRVPFYRYRTVFEEIEGEMVSRGSVVFRAREALPE